MLDLIIALGISWWWLNRKKKNKEIKQDDDNYKGYVDVDGRDYGYVKEGESIKELT